MIGELQYFAAEDRDIGLIRETNQDSTFAWVSSHEIPTALLITADGIGGGDHPAGDIASHLAVSTITDTLIPALESPISTAFYTPEKLEELLRRAIQRAHSTIYEAGRRNRKLQDMGTTAACALIHSTHLITAHVGDSRIYLLRGGQLRLLTRDHSAVGEMVADGLIPAERIYTHPLRNIITRSLGTSLWVEVESQILDIHPNDRILVCTDGLWEMVRDPQIAEILLQKTDAQAAVRALIAAAIHNGGVDNVGVAVCDIQAAAPHAAY